LFEDNADGGSIEWMNDVTIAHINSFIIRINRKTPMAISSTELIVGCWSDAGVTTTIMRVRNSISTTSYRRELWGQLLLCWVVLCWSAPGRIN
jgi:hypothetical protein